MKKIMIGILLIISFSCVNKHENLMILKRKNNIKKESFDDFFEKFNKDSIFQFSRINFPLNNEIYDVESNELYKENIKLENWKYFNFLALSKKYVKTVHQIKKDEVKINIQIIDTGVNVDYFFMVKNQKWILVKIVDEST